VSNWPSSVSQSQIILATPLTGLRRSREERLDGCSYERAADGTVAEGVWAVGAADEVTARQKHRLDRSIHTHATTLQLLQASILRHRILFCIQKQSFCIQGGSSFYILGGAVGARDLWWEAITGEKFVSHMLRYAVWQTANIQGGPKKPHTILLSISLLNIDRFS